MTSVAGSFASAPEALAALLDLFPDSTLLVDGAGHIHRANAGTTDVFGWEPTELEGTAISTLIMRCDEDDPVPLLAVEDPGGYRLLEARGRRRSGEEFLCEVSVHALRASLGEARWIVTVRDVSRRAFQESRRQASVKMAAITELAARVANDFNNQLAAVSGNLEAAWAAAWEHASPGLHHLAAAREATRRAARVVRRLSAMANPAPSTLRPIDPTVLVEHAVQTIASDAGDRVSVRSELNHGDWAVRADHEQIVDILISCCANALEAMPNGGLLTVSTHRSTSPEHAGSTDDDAVREFVRIDVSDTGHGIAADQLSRIFDPFYTTKRDVYGAGLGLAPVYGVLSQHEGGVTVESTLGVGTTMHVFLPRAAAVPASVAPPPDCDARATGSETILLVDDEPAVRQPTRRALERCGFQVIEASDGIEGMDRYREAKGRIKLVVLDVVMPQMNGWEVLDALKDDDPSLPVVLISGYPWTGGGSAKQTTTADAFLQKPYELSELALTVRQLLDASRPVR